MQKPFRGEVKFGDLHVKFDNTAPIEKTISSMSIGELEQYKSQLIDTLAEIDRELDARGG